MDTLAAWMCMHFDFRHDIKFSDWTYRHGRLRIPRVSRIRVPLYGLIRGRPRDEKRRKGVVRVNENRFTREDDVVLIIDVHAARWSLEIGRERFDGFLYDYD